MNAGHLLAQRHQLRVTPQAVRAGADFAPQLGVEILQRGGALLQTIEREVVGNLTRWIDRVIAR